MGSFDEIFEQALKEKDVEKLKIIICGYIDIDAFDSEKIKKVLQKIEKKEINIWQQHKEIEEVRPKTEWNLEYLSSIQADLMYNFSKKRMDLILEIGKHIYVSKNQNKNEETIDKDIDVSLSIDNKEDELNEENLKCNNDFISKIENYNYENNDQLLNNNKIKEITDKDNNLSLNNKENELNKKDLKSNSNLCYYTNKINKSLDFEKNKNYEKETFIEYNGKVEPSHNDSYKLNSKRNIKQVNKKNKKKLKNFKNKLEGKYEF